MPPTKSIRTLRVAGAIALLPPLFGAHSAAAGATVVSSALPGYSRIWIYRDYEPYVTLGRPYVRMNGTIVGVSDPGGAFYRDVPAGTYLVTVDSEGIDVHQFADVAVGPGATIYVKIEASRWWWSNSNGFRRDTFYTLVVDPRRAQAEIAAKQPVLYSGG